MKRTLLPIVLLLIAATLAAPAEAKRKRAPLQNAVCFDTALSDADRGECKKRFSDATTADQRAAIRKDFKRRAAKAKLAQQQPAPPAK